MTLWPLRRKAEIALLAFSLALSFAIFEVGYRVWLAHGLSRSIPNVDPGKALNFSAVNASFLREDKKLGFRFNKGNHEFISAFVTNGIFDRCESFRFRADRPDASGRLHNDLEAAALRIAVFGDSFTAIQWEGETWPSLLERELESRLGIKVAVLNLSRQGFGVLQMIDVAASTVPEVRPDVYLIAYITNDLIRQRFWLLEQHLRGRDRLLLSLQPDDVADPRISVGVSDYFQINTGITGAWCDRMTTAKAEGTTAALRKDSVVVDLLSQRRDMLADYNRPVFMVNFWTPRVSFIWNRIVYGNAFRNLRLLDPRVSHSRVEFDNFSADPGFRHAVETLRKSGIPAYLVHIPHHFEIQGAREFDYPRAGGTTEEQGANLRQSLEDGMGVQSLPLVKHLGGWRANPAAHIWKPDDHHPNRKGIEALAKAVADALIEQNITKFARR